MGSWRKRLKAMASEDRPTEWSYSDLASILKALGFREFGTGGSHRTWKLRRDGRLDVRVSLVDKGSGKVKQRYVRNMVAGLRAEGLLPAEGTDDEGPGGVET